MLGSNGKHDAEALLKGLTTLRCQDRVQRDVGCILCGTVARHNTNSCPLLFDRCYQCGEKGHGRAACTRTLEEFTVPGQFCCKCMLPLWTIYEDVQVHDGNCGLSCRHSLGDLGRKLFALARERKVSQFKLVLPGTSQGEDWKSLFQSRIPGVLSLFACLMPKFE